MSKLLKFISELKEQERSKMINLLTPEDGLTRKQNNRIEKQYQAIDDLTVAQTIDTLLADAEELRKSEVMYRKVIEQLPHRVYIQDVNLHYVLCNETYAQDHR